MNTSDVIKLLSINHSDSKIIGSFSSRDLRYWSDIDLQEDVLHSDDVTSRKRLCWSPTSIF